MITDYSIPGNEYLVLELNNSNFEEIWFYSK